MRLPLLKVARSQCRAGLPLQIRSPERIKFRAPGRNLRRTRLTLTRDVPSAFARDSQPAATDHRCGRSDESRGTVSADRPKLQIVRSRCRTIRRAYRPLEGTPMYGLYATVQELPQIGRMRMARRIIEQRTTERFPTSNLPAKNVT